MIKKKRFCQVLKYIVANKVHFMKNNQIAYWVPDHISEKVDSISERLIEERESNIKPFNL